MRAVLLRLIALGCVVSFVGQSAIGQNRAPEVPAAPDSQPADRGGPGVGNRPSDMTTEGAKAAPSGGVEASPLDTILMRDAKGNLVPVVGMPFEEFEQLLRAKKGISPASPPPYTLETVSLVGKATDEIADVQLTATIRVRESGWIRVPLHLAAAVVRQPMKHEGPGEYFLSYDATAGGYVCWLNGNDARPHVITISLSVALTGVGEERRLAFSVPRATESSLRIIVAAATADATLISGEGIATTKPFDGGHTEVTVLGAGGDLQLVWRPRRDTTKTLLQLDVSGEIATRIHSEHRIASDARLRVRSFGSLFDSFRVRLPPGMELIPTSSSGGYSVSAVDLEAATTNSATLPFPEQLVEVRLDKPASTIEVLLRAHREAEAPIAGLVSPAQFTVVGAVRQRGTIDFSMDGEWQLDWKEDKSVHRIDLTPDTTAARVVARYEYFQQPCGLQLKVSARPSRVSVEPVHFVYVEPNRLRVESLLKYRFRGTRSPGLAFELDDWNFDRLTPDALLDFPLESAGPSGKLNVPFRPGVAPPSELELKLEAHQALPATVEQLSFSFPRPKAEIVVPATIMIFTSDNVELTPQVAQLQGLSAETTVSRPAERQPSFAYRDLGGDEPARFVASLRMLKRSTTTLGKATVRIERQQIQIEQRIDYRVLHEPQRDFVLVTPQAVASSDGLDVLLNGQSLPTRQFRETSQTDERLTRLQFTAPKDLIGNFQVAVRYSLPLVWDRKAALSWTLPLAVPLEEPGTSFAGQQVEFQGIDNLSVQPEQDNLEEAIQAVPVRGTANTYSWDSETSVSQWILTPGHGAAAGAVHASQMWVQTWLTPLARHERVALRIRTLQESVRLRLPSGVKSILAAAVDGERVDAGFRSEGGPAPLVTVPLADHGRDCVVEVWYSLDPPPQQVGIYRSELRTAQVLEAEAPRRAYWQLVMPRSMHLVSMPDELSAEMMWSGDRWEILWRPVLDQRQLESWMKASRQDSLPAGSNEYLFGAIGRWPTLPIQVASRKILVSIASSCVLTLGLLLLHLRWLRRPSALFVAAVLLTGTALVWPEVAILIGQAGVWGLGIGVAIACWNWLTTRKPIREIRPAVAPPMKSSAPSTHSGGSRRELSSRVGTTQRAPLMEARP